MDLKVFCRDGRSHTSVNFNDSFTSDKGTSFSDSWSPGNSPKKHMKDFIRNNVFVNELPHEIEIFNLGGKNFMGTPKNETTDENIYKRYRNHRRLFFSGSVKITKFPKTLKKLSLSCCDVDLKVSHLPKGLKTFHLFGVMGVLAIDKSLMTRIRIQNSPKLEIEYL
jgi:hypothetical protein